MINNIIITLCEGPHDVAFIFRILKTKGFTSYSQQINQFPYPINDYLANEICITNIQDLKLEEVNKRLLPNEVLTLGTTLVLLYAIGGDSKVDARRNLLKSILELTPSKGDTKSFSIGSAINYSFLFLYDSDNKGIQNRLEYISTELSEILENPDAILFNQNGSVCEYGNTKFGAYIFANHPKDTGKLEDILIPLLKKDNEEIFTHAEDFITTKYEPNRIQRLKIKKDPFGMIIEHRDTKKGSYDKDKSIIGVVGQLQNSGATNTVCIKHSDYITLDKINTNHLCSQIHNVFKALMP